MHAATRRMLNCMYMDMANANAHDFARSFGFTVSMFKILQIYAGVTFTLLANSV